MNTLDSKLTELNHSELRETNGGVWGIFIAVIALGNVAEAAGEAYKRNYLDN